MKGQLNTLNLRTRSDKPEERSFQQEETERFYQEERIRRAREQEETQQMQEEIIATEKKETGRGVGRVTFFMMLTVAILADIGLFLLALIPYIGWLANILFSFCVFLTFFMWFKIKGMKYNSVKKMAALPAGFLIELIPYINILPGWTLSVIINTQGDKLASKVGIK